MYNDEKCSQQLELNSIMTTTENTHMLELNSITTTTEKTHMLSTTTPSKNHDCKSGWNA